MTVSCHPASPQYPSDVAARRPEDLRRRQDDYHALAAQASHAGQRSDEVPTAEQPFGHALEAVTGRWRDPIIAAVMSGLLNRHRGIGILVPLVSRRHDDLTVGVCLPAIKEGSGRASAGVIGILADRIELDDLGYTLKSVRAAAAIV